MWNTGLPEACVIFKHICLFQIPELTSCIHCFYKCSCRSVLGTSLEITACFVKNIVILWSGRSVRSAHFANGANGPSVIVCNFTKLHTWMKTNNLGQFIRAPAAVGTFYDLGHMGIHVCSFVQVRFFTSWAPFVKIKKKKKSCSDICYCCMYFKVK